MSKKKQVDKKQPVKGGTLIATVANDVTIDNYSDVLTPQDPTLEKRGYGKGLAIYDEVLNDGRCRTVLGKRKGKVVRREWTVEAASEEPQDEKAADLVRDTLKAVSFDRVCEGLLGATLKGYAVSETIWHRNDDGWVVPEKIISHNPARFVFDKKWKPRLLTRESGPEGIRLPERKYIVHRFGVEGNNPYGHGLGANLFWHVLFKREGVAFWMTFLNKFASPTPFGKYPMGTLEPDQKSLLNNLLAMVQAGALVAPIGTEVDFLQSGMSGDVTYENWCRYWDEQSSEVVLGSTLSTNVKGQGSRAASETHAEESELIADEDGDLISATLKGSLIKWIVEINIPNAATPDIWRPRPKNIAKEEEQKRKKHERQREAITVLGMTRKEGFEPKDVGGWLGDVMETEMVPVTTPEPDNPSDKRQEQSFTANSDHPIDHLIGQLEELAGDEDDEWIDQIRGVLESADTYEDAQRGLLELAGSLPVDPAGNIIGDAFVLAELTGRSDIHDLTGITSGGKGKGSKKN